jgi:uncharacterized protein YjbI with pentapeptide repeats
VPAATIHDQLRAGQAVNLARAEVTGTLDLTDLGHITVALRCQQCRFDGNVVLTDVVFDRAVDVSGSTFLAPFVAIGADFQAPFTAATGTAVPRTVFNASVVISQATFEDQASFDGAVFNAAFDATEARFRETASFDAADFVVAAYFPRATFGGLALFSGAPEPPLQPVGGATVAGAFQQGASFVGALFSAPAVFRQRVFHGPAAFDGAVLSDADFTLARFDDMARFGGASAGSLEMRAATANQPLDLSQALATKDVDLDGVLFVHGADLSNLTVKGTLSLNDIHVSGQLFTNRLGAGSLVMAVPDVSSVASRVEKERTLELIEASATKLDNLSRANDARYELLNLQGGDLSGFPWLWDRVVYRGICGYLVRPLRPLAAITLILVAGTIVRLLARRRSRPGPGARRGARVSAFVAITMHEGSRALGAIFRRKPEVAEPTGEDARPYLIASLAWTEWLLQKMLLVVFILCLGNANATLRQIIDSLRR